MLCSTTICAKHNGWELRQAQSAYKDETQPAMAKPHRIADVLGELLARRGYARIQAGEAMEQAWHAAAGKMAEQSKAGRVRRGVLEVVVANSTLLHELTFRKRELVVALARELPDQQLKDVRFRLGRIE